MRERKDEKLLSRKILGDQFIAWLEAGGIVPTNTRRVVVEASAGNIVMIHVEQYGTTEMLQFNPVKVFGANVSVVGGKPADA